MSRVLLHTMYSDAILTNLDEIVHAVFERARSMTEEEYLKNTTIHHRKVQTYRQRAAKPLSDEAKREKAYQAELEQVIFI